MSSVDPFSSRFEVFGRESRHLHPDINRGAFELLLRRLSPEAGADGRVVLLRAPRAGFGKTLLIQRAAEALGSERVFVKVTLVGGRIIDASRVLEYVLESLCQVLPAADGLTRLDLVARRVIARGLEPLVRSGEVPCQDREGALLALQQSPVETFDFHHERAVTAHWTEANFEILGPRLAAEVAQVSGASLREAAYWVELFFRFATTSPENVERSRLLFETVFRPEGLKPSDSGASERLHGLLALLGMVTSVVLVVDDTEGLSTHPPDALELGSFLTNLAQACPGTVVLLSVNTDVWDTAFAPRMPGGLADRLTEHEVVLAPLTLEEAEKLVRSRGGRHANDVLERLIWGDGELYARKVLKAASRAWEVLGLSESPGLPAEDEASAVGEAEEVPMANVDAPEEARETGGSPYVQRDVLADLQSLSPAAAALLEAAEIAPQRPPEAIAPERDVWDDQNLAAEPVPGVGESVLKPFEASAYAIPTTPLVGGSDFSAVEISAFESSAVARLGTPDQPLLSGDAVMPGQEDSFFKPEVAADLTGAIADPADDASTTPVPSSTAFGSPDVAESPAGQGDAPFAGQGGERTSMPAAGPSSPFVAFWNAPSDQNLSTPPGFDAAPSESAGQSVGSAPFPQPAGAEESRSEGSAVGSEFSNPFAPIAPQVPETGGQGGFVEAPPALEPVGSANNSFAPIAPDVPAPDFSSGNRVEPFPESTSVSPFAAVPAPAGPVSPFAAVPDPVVSDPPVASTPPSPGPPSPFTPVAPPQAPAGFSDPGLVSPPSPFTPLGNAPATQAPSGEVLPPAVESPFRPISAPPQLPAQTPFTPVDPNAGRSAEEPTVRMGGWSALMGARTPGAGGGAPESKPGSPAPNPATPFSPVGEGGLPPKRTNTLPGGKMEAGLVISPFEADADPTPSVQPPIPGPASRPAGPSPFAPVTPPPVPPASSPFAPSGTGPSQGDALPSEDEDKVDALLRQFKERYGRD